MSVIYRLDPASSLLVPYLEIATQGIYSFAYFTIGSEKYLAVAVANRQDKNRSESIDSAIFRYNPMSGFYLSDTPHLQCNHASLLHNEWHSLPSRNKQ